MLRLQGVVVAYDAACLWAILVCGSCAVCKMTQRRKVLFDIQDVGMGVHTLHKSQMFPAISACILVSYPGAVPEQGSLVSCKLYCIWFKPSHCSMLGQPHLQPIATSQ